MACYLLCDVALRKAAVQNLKPVGKTQDKKKASRIRKQK